VYPRSIISGLREDQMTIPCRTFLASFLTVSMITTPLSSGQRQVETPCQAHMSFIGGGEYFPHFYHEDPPAEAQPVLGKPLHDTVETFLVAPINSDEYVRVFGQKGSAPATITQAQSTEITKIKQRLQADFHRTAGNRDINGDNYKRVIGDSKSSYVLIVGHNDDGFFHFLDGSTTLLDDLVTAARPDQRLVLLSCKAESRLSNQSAKKAAATQYELTYAQAFDIATKVQQFIASAGSDISLGAIRDFLQGSEAQSSVRYKVGVFATKAVCAAGAIIVIALVISAAAPCLKKDDCK
jgi:hypothetical protein